VTRRDFLAFAQALGLASWFADAAFGQQGSVRTRRSATAKAAASDIAILRDGVSKLKANKTATDYTSWMYWANTHGTPDPIPPAMTKVWFQCHHGTEHFLSWHRAYLFFFETLIREVTKKDEFALPYWNWYRSAAIPPAYAEQKVGSTENSLFHNERAYSKRTLLTTALGEDDFDAFQGGRSGLEGNPHGTVHVMVGWEMGAVETSARDPIFWAHHTNIDRLWEVWLGLDTTKHKNPTDKTWLNTPFTFDTAGKKSRKAEDLLKTTDLWYQYDSLAVAPEEDVLPAKPTHHIAVPAITTFTPTADLKAQTLADTKGIVLTGQSTTLDIRTPKAAADLLQSVASDTSGRSGRLNLLLEGVKPTPTGQKRGFEYRLYLNLPPAPKEGLAHRDFYLGVLNSFRLSHDRSDVKRVVFRIDPSASRLAPQGLWNPQALSVSLISDDPTKEPLVEIAAVRLVVER